MDINTGKLASNSSLFLKKIKDNDTNVNKTNTNKESLSPRILNDFAEIKTSNRDIARRIIENNNRLTQYEENYNRLEFIEQKTNLLSSLFNENKTDDMMQVIENSTFRNRKVLKDYFKGIDNFPEAMQQAQKEIETTRQELANEFKAIEITSQNIMSVYSTRDIQQKELIAGLNPEELIRSTTINSKRVVDLISQ